MQTGAEHQTRERKGQREKTYQEMQCGQWREGVRTPKSHTALPRPLSQTQAGMRALCMAWTGASGNYGLSISKKLTSATAVGWSAHPTVCADQ